MWILLTAILLDAIAYYHYPPPRILFVPHAVLLCLVLYSLPAFLRRRFWPAGPNFLVFLLIFASAMLLAIPIIKYGVKPPTRGEHYWQLFFSAPWFCLAGVIALRRNRKEAPPAAEEITLDARPVAAAQTKALPGALDRIKPYQVALLADLIAFGFCPPTGTLFIPHASALHLLLAGVPALLRKTLLPGRLSLLTAFMTMVGLVALALVLVGQAPPVSSRGVNYPLVFLVAFYSLHRGFATLLQPPPQPSSVAGEGQETPGLQRLSPWPITLELLLYSFLADGIAYFVYPPTGSLFIPHATAFWLILCALPSLVRTLARGAAIASPVLISLFFAQLTSVLALIWQYKMAPARGEHYMLLFYPISLYFFAGLGILVTQASPPHTQGEKDAADLRLASPARWESAAPYLYAILLDAIACWIYPPPGPFFVPHATALCVALYGGATLLRATVCRPGPSVPALVTSIFIMLSVLVALAWQEAFVPTRGRFYWVIAFPSLCFVFAAIMALLSPHRRGRPSADAADARGAGAGAETVTVGEKASDPPSADLHAHPPARFAKKPAPTWRAILAPFLLALGVDALAYVLYPPAGTLFVPHATVLCLLLCGVPAGMLATRSPIKTWAEFRGMIFLLAGATLGLLWHSAHQPSRGEYYWLVFVPAYYFLYSGLSTLLQCAAADYQPPPAPAPAPAPHPDIGTITGPGPDTSKTPHT